MLFLLLVCIISTGYSIGIDEFAVYGPDVLNKRAIDKYLEARKADPSNDKLNSDSPLMKAAQEYAVKRYVTRSPEEIRRKVLEDGSTSKSALQLPSPDSRDGVLASAVTVQSTGAEVMVLSEHANALAVVFDEEINAGAITRAGALPMGTNGVSWLNYAEDKLKRDAQLGHQELLWELGTQLTEDDFVRDGGVVNTTFEEDLLDKVTAWFVKGGGRMHFTKPIVGKNGYFALKVTEDLLAGDKVLSIPFNLMISRVTASNVLIPNKNKYVGAELKATFEKNELWGLVIFVLHEYYKEINGDGSKWGPFLRTLKARFLTTDAMHALKSTTALELSHEWMSDADALSRWSSSHEGPCSPISYICRSKPKERTGDSRFTLHQIRWAYWVVKQNAVYVQHNRLAIKYLALIPFYDMIKKDIDSGGDITLERDNSVTIKVGKSYYSAGSKEDDWRVETDEEGESNELKNSTEITKESELVAINPGNFNDAEFYLRYLNVPLGHINRYNGIKLNLPGTLPRGNPFLFCLKNPKEQRRNEKCRGSEVRSGSMFWQTETLTKWRKELNLPPRMSEFMHIVNKLHLYGDDREEQKKISAANALAAGLPVSDEVISHEEQLLLLGLAQTNEEALTMLQPVHNTLDTEAPQLFSAPDPNEDPEAKKAMEELASLALQVQKSISAGNIGLNATQAVLNATQQFFQYGVLPEIGLDALDDFLLKKIGMVLHCGYSDDMVIEYGHISKELYCAMRVHLMNETEVHTFCPATARIWNENCQDVEFMNYTAISYSNEMNVNSAFRKAINNLLDSYPSTIEADKEMLHNHMIHSELAEEDPSSADTSKIMSNVMIGAVQLRLREKEMLKSALKYVDDYEEQVIASVNWNSNSTCKSHWNCTADNQAPVLFQLEWKVQERAEADVREEKRQQFIQEIRERSQLRLPLATIEVNVDNTKINLTLHEGHSVKDTVLLFCKKHNIPASNAPSLEKALQSRVVNPTPLLLLLGVVTPVGDRRILGIPIPSSAHELSNVTEENRDKTYVAMETRIFCARNNITTVEGCDGVLDKVYRRLNIHNPKFVRKILLQVPVDAPDGRKLQLIIREGEQHDILQFTMDFLEFYHMDQGSAQMLASEVLKRLPAAVLQIPVGLPNQRKVIARFAEHDNVTAISEAFVNVFEIDESMKLQIVRYARAGLAPGSYVV